MARNRLRIVLLIATASALVAAGCSDSGSDTAAVDAFPAPEEAGPQNASSGNGSAEEQGKGLNPLLDNRAEANQLIAGDLGTLEEKLASLKGYPVVVNQWASWCDPCRAELPFFVDSAFVHQEEIAFIGIDMDDSRDAAEAFLEDVPLPFPSIEDPNAAAIASLGGGVVSPTTVFIDKKGEVQNVFAGSYQSRAQLEDDIAQYLGVES